MVHANDDSTGAPAQGAPACVPDSAIRDCMLALLQARTASASLCPSEVARRLAPSPETAWRALLPRVRTVAVALAKRELLQFSQRGVEVGPEPLPAGPLRIRRGPGFPAR